jgi:hypothetical protein
MSLAALAATASASALAAIAWLGRRHWLSRRPKPKYRHASKRRKH